MSYAGPTRFDTRSQGDHQRQERCRQVIPARLGRTQEHHRVSRIQRDVDKGLTAVKIVNIVNIVNAVSRRQGFVSGFLPANSWRH